MAIKKLWYTLLGIPEAAEPLPSVSENVPAKKKNKTRPNSQKPEKTKKSK